MLLRLMSRTSRQDTALQSEPSYCLRVCVLILPELADGVYVIKAVGNRGASAARFIKR